MAKKTTKRKATKTKGAKRKTNKASKKITKTKVDAKSNMLVMKSHPNDLSNRMVLIMLILVILVSTISIILFISSSGEIATGEEALAGQAIELDERARAFAEEQLEKKKGDYPNNGDDS